jgi:hypothetical protein
MVFPAAPIAGRALVGQSLRVATVGLSGPHRLACLLGLRPSDARFALRARIPRALREGYVDARS